MAFDKMFSRQMCIIELLHAEKKCTHWHSTTLVERLWRPSNGCKHSFAVATVMFVTQVKIKTHHTHCDNAVTVQLRPSYIIRNNKIISSKLNKVTM